MKQLIKLCFFIIASAIICHNVFAQDMGVKSVNSSSKTVTIKSGKDNGLTKGSRVCFYNDSKKITCGKVKKVRKSMSIVKVRKSKLKKISTDSIARVSTSRRRKKRLRGRNTFRTGLKLSLIHI